MKGTKGRLWLKRVDRRFSSQTIWNATMAARTGWRTAKVNLPAGLYELRFMARACAMDMAIDNVTVAKGLCSTSK